MHAGRAIREGRQRRAMSLQRLSRRSGVSAAQLSRTERGLTRRPEVRTLVAVARALALDPQPLLAAAGHIDLATTRRLLADLLRPDDLGVAGEWISLGRDPEAARAALLDPETPAAEVRALAARVFATCRARDEGWAGEGLVAPGRLPDDPELDALHEAWRCLPPARRERVLAYARDQVLAAAAEWRAG